jgi:TIR domain
MLPELDEVVFWDQDLTPGEEWFPRICAAIDRSQHLFVFWCSHSAASVEVQREFLYALSRKKRVVPLLVDNTPLAPELAAIHGIDLRKVVVHEVTSQPSAVREQKAVFGDRDLKPGEPWFQQIARQLRAELRLDSPWEPDIDVLGDEPEWTHHHQACAGVFEPIAYDGMTACLRVINRRADATVTARLYFQGLTVAHGLWLGQHGPSLLLKRNGSALLVVAMNTPFDRTPCVTFADNRGSVQTRSIHDAKMAIRALDLPTAGSLQVELLAGTQARIIDFDLTRNGRRLQGCVLRRRSWISLKTSLRSDRRHQGKRARNRSFLSRSSGFTADDSHHRRT